MYLFRRNRNIRGKPNKWIVDKDSVKPHENKYGIEAILKNDQTGVLLKLELNARLKDGSVLHMRINEAHPGRERFDASEALNANIEYAKLTLDKVTDKDIKVKYGPSGTEYIAVINISPFRVDVFDGEKLVLSSNAREFFKFEHYRKKPIMEGSNDLNPEVISIYRAFFCFLLVHNYVNIFLF